MRMSLAIATVVVPIAFTTPVHAGFSGERTRISDRPSIAAAGHDYGVAHRKSAHVFDATGRGERTELGSPSDGWGITGGGRAFISTGGETTEAAMIAPLAVDDSWVRSGSAGPVDEIAVVEDAAVSIPTRDPLRPFNKVMWAVNRTTDRFVFKPVATVYRKTTPKFFRKGVGNAFDNLGEPWSAVNNLLQAKPGRAFDNVKRFTVNTTVGLGGLTDRASKFGVRPAREDFGQTLAVWGVKSSAYLVMPIFGPSTVRDGIGTGVGMFADPVQIGIKQSGLSSMARRGITALEITSRRAGAMEPGNGPPPKSTLAPYDAAREGYFQRRALEVENKDES
jgi:ABC-type transporter lipoprotein component MlaA